MLHLELFAIEVACADWYIIYSRRTKGKDVKNVVSVTL